MQRMNMARRQEVWNNKMSISHKTPFAYDLRVPANQDNISSSLLSESDLKQLFGKSYCFLVVTTEGAIESYSHEIWHGFAIKKIQTENRTILEKLTTDGHPLSKLQKRWLDWLLQGGQPIRLWANPTDSSSSRFPLEVRSVPYHKADANGNLILLIIKDLTEEWTKREKWRRRLYHARKKTEDAYLDFASWLHDWKTPLSTIESSTWLSLRYNKDSDQEKKLRHLKKIDKAVQEMKIGMQDWQTWHEPPTLRRIQRVRINNLIKERIEQLKPLLKPGQIIQFWHQGKLETHTDPNALTHVLDNLLSNASKYSPDQSLIWVRLWNVDDRLQIDIQDEGIGIPEAEWPRLFEPRYRASNATNTPGNGLGLATVERLVKQLGGHVQVKSKLNHGTTISITLKNQHKTYEKDLDHRRQSRNPLQHRRDPGAGPVPNPNR